MRERWLAPAAFAVAVVAVGIRTFRNEPGTHPGRGNSVTRQLVVSSGGVVDAGIRQVPLELRPRHDLSGLVQDNQLADALAAAQPRWQRPSTALLLHAFRLWGPNAAFDSHSLEGRAILEALLDNTLAMEVIHQHFDAFLVDSAYGIRVLSNQDAYFGSERAEPHYDKLLQVLGETGTAGDAPVRTSSGRVGTVQDIVQDSLARFTLAQELEFTTCALVRWLPPRSSWVNRFGRRYAFSELAQALSARPLGVGACHGSHVPFALVNLLVADEQERILDAATRELVARRLADFSRQLERSQLPSGAWDKQWSGNYNPAAADPFTEWKPHFDRISATGHHLEWVALAPPGLRPHRQCIVRAIAALIDEIAALPPGDRAEGKGYLPLTHAARALALLRGVDPWGFWTAQKERKR